MKRALALLLALPLAAAAPAQSNPSALWQQFVDARTAGEEPPFPDFSYAGYRRGEARPPHVAGSVFDVRDFGAVANDALEDRTAIQAAITAAENAGGGVVLLPPGRLIFNTAAAAGATLRIRRSNIVLRGAGSGEGGTELFMERNFTPTDSARPWTTPWMVEVAPQGQSAAVVTVPTEIAPMDADSVVVADASALAPGDWVRLSMADAAAMEEWLAPWRASGAWTRLFTDGIRASECHQVDRVEGNRVFLRSRLQVAVDPQYNWTLRRLPIVEEVGFEDILFRGNWTTPFVHHQNATHDYGWSALLLTYCVNSWVQRCRFVDWNYAVQLDRSSYCTVLHTSLEGNGGHFGFTSRGGSNTLFALTRDLSGAFHSASWGYESSGVVFWRYDYAPSVSFDAHTGTPYATLLDVVTGGLRYGHNSGPIEGLPNHLRDLVLWNFTQVGAPSPRHSYWRADPFAYDKIVMPRIVGFTGNGTSFEESTVQLESFGTRVEPESLLQAQLALRLGAEPAWIPQARRDWDVVKEARTIIPTHDSVSVRNAATITANAVNTLDAMAVYTGLSPFATNLAISGDGAAPADVLLDGETDRAALALVNGADGVRRVTLALRNITASAAPVEIEVLLDRVPPSAPQFAKWSLATKASPVLLEWNPASDGSGSGVAGYDVQVGEGTPFFTETNAATVDLPEGVYAVRVRAADGAGNRGAWSDPLSLEVDQTPPAAATNVAVTPGGNYGPGSWATAAEAFEVIGTAEPGSTARVAWRGVDYTAIADGTGSFRVAVTAGAEGEDPLQLTLIDAAGNESAPQALTVFVDRTPPSFSFGFQPAVVHASTDPIVQPIQYPIGSPVVADGALFLTPTVGNVAVESVTFDGFALLIAIRPADPSAILTGSLRVRGLEGALRDAAGNRSAASAFSEVWIIDVTAPVGAFAPRLPYQAGGAIELFTAATDDHPLDGALHTLYERRPGLAWQVASLLPGPGSFSWSPPGTGAQFDGVYTFALRVEDAGRNTGFPVSGPLPSTPVLAITFNSQPGTPFLQPVDDVGTYFFPITNERVATLAIESLVQPGMVEVARTDGLPTLPPRFIPGLLLAERWTFDTDTARPREGTLSFTLPATIPPGIGSIDMAWRLPPGGGPPEPHAILPGTAPGTLTVAVCEIEGTWVLGNSRALPPPDVFEIF